MRLLVKSFESPVQNLAFEEHLFKSFSEDILRIWINPVSVICGKHQNAYSESNFHFCRENKIPIIRRLSGGGTVFHDQGNINFSFFRLVDKSNPIDYHKNLLIIQRALSELGLDVQMSPRHDLFSGKFKISGNAQHISGGKALHHGTILYDSDLSRLKPAIKREVGIYKDKAVKSVRSPVVNLRTINDLGSSQEFQKQLSTTLGASMDAYDFDDSIGEELLNKYASTDWNFGYGPAYTLYNEQGKDNLTIEVERGGKIIAVSSNNEDWLAILNKLLGKKHQWEVVSSILESTDTSSLALKSLLF